MTTELLYGKPLADWNRLAGLDGAQPADIETTARLHVCGVYRGYSGPAGVYGLTKNWNAMTASERLCATFDLRAPCCGVDTMRERRSLREVMRDKSIAEQASVRVGGDTPRRMLREVTSVRVGWES